MERYCVLLSLTGAARAIHLVETVMASNRADAALACASTPRAKLMRPVAWAVRDALLPSSDAATPIALHDKDGLAVAYAYVVGPLKE